MTRPLGGAPPSAGPPLTNLERYILEHLDDPDLEEKIGPRRHRRHSYAPQVEDNLRNESEIRYPT